MKKILISALFSLLFIATASPQTFKSSYTIKPKEGFDTEWRDRVIYINDKEISISNFGEGKETLYLNVKRIEEKEDFLDGKRKYYYCVTRDKDPINGYQNATVCKTPKSVKMLLFATEIDVYFYSFEIQ